MEIPTFITESTKAPIALDVLTTVAATRAAHGDDVLAAFRSQIELRSTAAQTVLDTAQAAGRDTLLASEQRDYDRQIRERDAILGLQRSVEARTSQIAYVPASQHGKPPAPSVRPRAVLTPEQRAATWLEDRGHYTYQQDPGADAMRLGSFIVALATGRRDHMSDLERRALAEGADATGGFLVPEIVGARFIDRVREQVVVQRAGAQTVPMTSDTLHLARVAPPGISTMGSPVANAAIGAWKTENELIDESDLTLERVTLTARTLPLLLKMSVELFEDATNIVEIVEAEMAASTALELDRVALVGAGVAPEPRGILNTPGVQTDTLTIGTNYDWLVDAAGLLWAENFEPNAAVMGVVTAITLAKLKTATGDNSPLAVPPTLSGIRQLRSSAAGARVFVGDFTELLIGMRTSFRVEATRTGAGTFERLQVAVRSYLRADIALAHPEAFVVLT